MVEPELFAQSATGASARTRLTHHWRPPQNLGGRTVAQWNTVLYGAFTDSAPGHLNSRTGIVSRRTLSVMMVAASACGAGNAYPRFRAGRQTSAFSVMAPSSSVIRFAIMLESTLPFGSSFVTMSVPASPPPSSWGRIFALRYKANFRFQRFA